MRGFALERHGPTADGTVFYLLTLDTASPSGVLPYDCDQDYEESRRGQDLNTTFLGRDLASLIANLNVRLSERDKSVVCMVNGGFFGESGWSVAHHEEPMAFEGKAYYPVDLLRPRDQAAFFIGTDVQGHLHFSLASSITVDEMKKTDFVLGGVRPLRIEGKSLPLAPGAGGTGLRCSRTSIGWSADGNKLYILVVHDPDGELASQIQRCMHWTQTGGWDVHEVQRYWEQQDVPNAVPFDGGESTQLAFLQPGDRYHVLDSGCQYSFTVGYLFQRPLVAAFPILPPSEAHRGVLNYLFVTGR